MVDRPVKATKAAVPAPRSGGVRGKEVALGNFVGTAEKGPDRCQSLPSMSRAGSDRSGLGDQIRATPVRRCTETAHRFPRIEVLWRTSHQSLELEGDLFAVVSALQKTSRDSVMMERIEGRRCPPVSEARGYTVSVFEFVFEVTSRDRTQRGKGKDVGR